MIAIAYKNKGDLPLFWLWITQSLIVNNMEWMTYAEWGNPVLHTLTQLPPGAPSHAGGGGCATRGGKSWGWGGPQSGPMWEPQVSPRPLQATAQGRWCHRLQVSLSHWLVGPVLWPRWGHVLRFHHLYWICRPNKVVGWVHHAVDLGFSFYTMNLLCSKSHLANTTFIEPKKPTNLTIHMLSFYYYIIT